MEILLGIIVILLSFISYNLFQQVNQLENEIKTFDQKEKELYEQVEKYYQVFMGMFVEAYTQMQRIDKNGAFSSDDEVGFSFKVLQRSIEMVKNKLENLRNEE